MHVASWAFSANLHCTQLPEVPALPNPDTTCLQIAIFTALFHVRAVRELLCSVDADDVEDGFCKKLIALFKALQQGERPSARARARLWGALDPSFAQGQQCANDFLLALLDRLSRVPELAAVSALFERSERSSFTCIGCDEEWEQKERTPVPVLQVPVRERGPLTLADTFSDYSASELVPAFRCRECMQTDRVFKALVSSRGPHILAVQLKRMRVTVDAKEGARPRKVQTPVSFPSHCPFGGRRYRFESLVSHQGGSTQGGHNAARGKPASM